MDNITRQRVIEHVQAAMDAKITKLTIESPFNPLEVEERNPFGFRLAPIEVWQGSKFERSFVTTLGQGIFEQVGKIIAEGSGAFAENQHSQPVTLNTFQSETIDNIIAAQTSRREGRGRITPPTLHDELTQLRGLNTRSNFTFDITSDLYVRRQNGQEEFYSFKTVKPNKDQTAAAKKILLSLRTFNEDFKAYFALPYNPGGDGNPYARAEHSVPKRLFDMDDEDFVLIGSSLWNKLGDNPNTFDELLDIFSEVGLVTAERIRREYFDLD